MEVSAKAICCNWLKEVSVTVISFTGASTFPGLRKFIAEKSQTRVLSLLHIAAHGLASAGCTSSGMRDSLEIF